MSDSRARGGNAVGCVCFSKGLLLASARYDMVVFGHGCLMQCCLLDIDWGVDIKLTDHFCSLILNRNINV